MRGALLDDDRDTPPASHPCTTEETIASDPWNIEESALPRCFILNENHRVILVCSPRPGDPLHARFMPKAHANLLPPTLDRIVRAMEEACDREQTHSKTVAIGSTQFSLSRLHGEWGDHTTLVIDKVAA